MLKVTLPLYICHLRADFCDLKVLPVADADFNIVAEFDLQSNRKRLLYNGNSYVYHSSTNRATSDEMVFWTCVGYQKGCKAQAITKVVNGTTKMRLSTEHHNHL